MNEKSSQPNYSSMGKRDVIRMVLDHKKPPYVPWSLSFTYEAAEKLHAHYQTSDLATILGNHILELGSKIGYFTDLGENRVEDLFKVVWNRSLDKDIGNVEGQVLPEPSLKGYTFPNPCDGRIFDDIATKIALRSDCFRLFMIGFSLYERAWALRGMKDLWMDFIQHPEFVKELFAAIADFNITQIKKALTFEIDGVYFGDDWGQQSGLQMGPRYWRKFIFPELQRMYEVVHAAGKYVFIHSCGDVDELFPELIEIGVNCFNPFQPEVMDVMSLMDQYRGRLSFYGGLSTQRTLPFGSTEDVCRETNLLLSKGRQGNLIFSAAHSVEGDVPLENMLEFIKILHAQPGLNCL